jgi:hypothetical protein
MRKSDTDGAGPRVSGSEARRQGRTRSRTGRAFASLCMAMAMCAVTLVGVVSAGAPVAGAAAAPTCVFNGGGLFGPLVMNVKAGESINIDCKGFPASHPYLLIETSLLVAVDPAAKPLLTGQVTSLPGLLGVIAALPEMNALSTAFPSSNASGVLDTNYTVPTSQPTDPNATCPPTTVELRSGLIGCAVAMLDLETFKPVVVGTMVLSYAGQQLFQPNPTLKLSPTAVKVGQRVSLSDIPGATTYWWLATLVSLESNLGGGGGSASVFPVTITGAGKKLKSTGIVTPASYNGTTFTPPKLSGYFIAKGKGKKKVSVTLTANLLGFGIAIGATGHLVVSK